MDNIEAQVQTNEVLSVSSNSIPSIEYNVRERKTINNREALQIANISDVKCQGQSNESKELDNCESIFPKLIKNELITNFPLTNDARINVNYKLPETGVISVSNDDPQVKFYSSYPSVSKIISDTKSNASKIVLERWKKRMIKALGQEKFGLLQKGKFSI